MKNSPFGNSVRNKMFGQENVLVYIYLRIYPYRLLFCIVKDKGWIGSTKRAKELQVGVFETGKISSY